MFDNGGINTFGNFGMMEAEDDHSRILEFRVDEATREAVLTWEWPGSFDVDPWYSEEWLTPFWGDADRLDNDNVLVCAGRRSATEQTRLFEVTRDDGQVVWELLFPPNYGSYRAQRLSPPPLVERIQ